MATKTETIKLNQYEGSDYVKMADFNNDNLLIDKAFKEDRQRIENIKNNVEKMDFSDTKIQITDKNDKFTGSTLDEVLDELADNIEGINPTAESTTYTDTHTIGATNVQQAVDKTVNKVDTDITVSYTHLTLPTILRV